MSGLLALGLSHRTAPLALREQLALTEGRAAGVLNALVSEEPISEAVALSIDRGAIYNVLLQKQGEISGALLPLWIGGYSFLFATERDVSRARQLASPPRTLAFAYDRQDAMMRAIGERIAVNPGP